MGGRRERIQPVKRPLALLGAVIVLCAAWLGSRAVESNRAGTVKREAARGAETAGMRAADALAAHVRELKLEAQNAATNPRLVAALRGNADAATLQDLFRTEEWWEPYRNAFRVYAVAFDSDKLDVIEGMKTAEFSSESMAAAMCLLCRRNVPRMVESVSLGSPSLSRPVDTSVAYTGFLPSYRTSTCSVIDTSIHFSPLSANSG